MVSILLWTYLNGGVIFIHKVVLDELDGECALAHASSAHHDQLILRHVCCCSSPVCRRARAHTPTHTHAHPHTAPAEKKGSREMCRLAVWQMKHWCWTGHDVVVHNWWQNTEHTFVTIIIQWRIKKGRWFVCVISGVWSGCWDPQRGMWKMCWRYSMFQSFRTRCEQQGVCMRGRATWQGERDMAHWPPSLRRQITDAELWSW